MMLLAGAGLWILLDGKTAAHSATIGRLTADIVQTFGVVFGSHECSLKTETPIYRCISNQHMYTLKQNRPEANSEHLKKECHPLSSFHLRQLFITASAAIELTLFEQVLGLLPWHRARGQRRRYPLLKRQQPPQY
jgi:hypothetical protein